MVNDARADGGRCPRCGALCGCGGVAAAFEGLLREVLAHGGYRVGLIAASPAEGLIKYHYGK